MKHHDGRHELLTDNLLLSFHGLEVANPSNTTQVSPVDSTNAAQFHFQFTASQHVAEHDLCTGHLAV
jgi:hypothetical protein